MGVSASGVGDVLIGAAALAASHNGVAAVSHVRDKLVEMTHLNETIYSAGIAASHEAHRTAAGNYQPDDLLANVCKHNVTRFPFEISRLAQDLAGGLVANRPIKWRASQFPHAWTPPGREGWFLMKPGSFCRARRSTTPCARRFDWMSLYCVSRYWWFAT